MDRADHRVQPAALVPVDVMPNVRAFREGFPPEEVRGRLLEAGDGGSWSQAGRENGCDPVVRRAFAVLLREAFREFPVLYSGTRTEVEWLKPQMEASGNPVTIAKIVEG